MRVLTYCWGIRILVSRSRGLSVLAFGLEEGLSDDVRIGIRYGERGMYVWVWLPRLHKERRMWRWRGLERVLGTSLKKRISWCVKAVRKGEVLNGTQWHLNKWINQRSKFTLLTSRSLCVNVTSSSKNGAPKIHAVHELPIVHSFVSFLKVRKYEYMRLQNLNQAHFCLHFHAISQMDGKLSDVTESVLIRSCMV